MRSDLIEGMVRTIEKHLGSPTFRYSGGSWSLVIHEDDVDIYTGDELADVVLQAFVDARNSAKVAEEMVA